MKLALILLMYGIAPLHLAVVGCLLSCAAQAGSFWYGALAVVVCSVSYCLCAGLIYAAMTRYEVQTEGGNHGR